MSADILLGGLGGVVVGVVLGVVVERIARTVGLLRCEISGWERKFTAARNGFGDFPEIEPEQAKMFAKRVEYRFAIDLFNGKELPTGLRDITVELVRNDGEPLTSRPYDLRSGRRDQAFEEGVYNTVDVINIPPRMFVHMELAGSFDSREAVNALVFGKWSQVQLVGKKPKRSLLWRKTYRKTIAKP